MSIPFELKQNKKIIRLKWNMQKAKASEHFWQGGWGGWRLPRQQRRSAQYLVPLHVLHVEAALVLFSFLVLLLLAEALLDDAEAAGEDEEGGYHGDGD